MSLRHAVPQLKLRPDRLRYRLVTIDGLAHNPSRRIGAVQTCRYSSSSSTQSASDKKDPISLSPASSNHHDLKSFLAYARRTGLSEKSTVYIGTHYEYTTAVKLARYGFTLRRIGGSSDFGTDLVGTWTPLRSGSGSGATDPDSTLLLSSSAPSMTRSPTLRVLIQCKASMHRGGPFLIRELEGAFAGAPPGWRDPNTMALLVTEKPATKGVRDALGRSRWPMGYVCCSRAEGGAVRQMIWNMRAEEVGLEGFGVAARHVPGAVDEGELVLTRHGEPLPLLNVD